MSTSTTRSLLRRTKQQPRAAPPTPFSVIRLVCFPELRAAARTKMTFPMISRFVAILGNQTQRFTDGVHPSISLIRVYMDSQLT